MSHTIRAAGGIGIENLLRNKAALDFLLDLAQNDIKITCEYQKR